MRSLRLDDQLDERVREAAAAEGSSVSEFIRRAVAERAESTLSTGASARLADVVGAIHGDGGQARDSGRAFSELLAQRHLPA
jgi:Arc/MetJ-type ribon-helix-helix transcriptional regulator